MGKPRRPRHVGPTRQHRSAWAGHRASRASRATRQSTAQCFGHFGLAQTFLEEKVLLVLKFWTTKLRFIGVFFFLFFRFWLVLFLFSPSPSFSVELNVFKRISKYSFCAFRDRKNLQTWIQQGDVMNCGDLRLSYSSQTHTCQLGSSSDWQGWT